MFGAILNGMSMEILFKVVRLITRAGIILWDSVYLRLTPFDSVDVGTPFISNTIIIENSAPVITGVSLSPDPATAGTHLTCVVSLTIMTGTQPLYL